MTESDPNGKNAHEPGAKLDAGKIRPALVFKAFAHALWKVAEVGTYGANKYTENGWLEVPNGEARYGDAEMRHMLKDWMGEQCDPDTEIEHQAHKAWNALAQLELMIRRKNSNDGDEYVIWKNVKYLAVDSPGCLGCAFNCSQLSGGCDAFTCDSFGIRKRAVIFVEAP